MFETSVVRARAIAAPRRGGLLTASIAFHSLLAAAAITMSVQSFSFPNESPRQMGVLLKMAPLPPLPKGNPDAPRDATPRPQPPAQPQHAQTAPPPPQAEVTPNVIPNTTTPVASTDTGGPTNGSGNNTGERFGDRNGSDDGVDIGQPIMPQAQIAAPAGPLMPVGDVHAARVLSRVEPKYPPAMARARISAVVRVHCVIDKNGNITDPEITMSTFPAFNQSVLDALQRWTFAPGTLHGQPVDTYFELTITFNAR